MEGLTLILDRLSDAYFIGSLFLLILFLIGMINLLKRKRYREKAISAIGEVEELIEEIGARRTVFYPLISFDLTEGRTVAYKSGTGTSPSAYKKRQKVKVLFLPENPKDFIIDDENGYFLELFFLITGLIGFLTCISIFLLNQF